MVSTVLETKLNTVFRSHGFLFLCISKPCYIQRVGKEILAKPFIWLKIDVLVTKTAGTKFDEGYAVESAILEILKST